MSTVDVTGGVDGIAAHIDDLHTLAAVLRTTCVAVEDALNDVTAPALQWALVAVEADDRTGIASVVRELGAQRAALQSVDELAASLTFLVVAAAAAYSDAEQSVGTSFLDSLADTVWGSTTLLPPTLMASITGVPERDFSPVYALPRLLSPFVIDGSPVLHDLGSDPITSIPPRTLSDLVLDLSTRNQGRPGEISVSFVTGADGVRRAIVDIPGTKSWNPAPVADVTSVGTDILAIAEHGTSYERGVFEALADAGVHPDDPVMLVGHSEGGIVAVNAARDAAESGRFRITHVVTAGSPVGALAADLPANVQLLSLENTADIVPALDDVPNPDRPNVTTVRADEPHGSIGANHDLLQSYEPEAVSAQNADSGSVDAFLHSADGFLSSDTMSTHAYQVTRSP
jgi:hypothetical protein